MSAYIDTAQIAEILGMSRDSIHTLTKRAGFPRPVPELTPTRGNQWNRAEVLAFLTPSDPAALDGVIFKRRSTKPPTMRQHLLAALGNARRRSGRKAREFALTMDDVQALFDKQEGRCAVSGITFSLEHDGNGPAPFSPSLDRIDSKCGYVRGNVRLVCCSVNLMMNVWGETVFHQIAEAMRATK